MQIRTTTPVISISTGQAQFAGPHTILQSTPLGSCIAIVLLDPIRSIGAMAHIMLPGRAPANVQAIDRLRYAPDAIEWMIAKLLAFGSAPSQCYTALIGGGNVLQRPDDMICAANIQSVSEWMQRCRFTIVARCLGGYDRRCAILDIEQKSILRSCGDDFPTVLWRETTSPMNYQSSRWIEKRSMCP
ncbi:MAG: chemotaxis protein CheD [Sedimentisphaerales bacterium]|nr:chemotaxis protein CheD [Sedimentisphaerales bacterium]